jgi:hypothetical protein
MRRAVRSVVACAAVAAALGTAGCSAQLLPPDGSGSACLPPGALNRPRGKFKFPFSCVEADAGGDQVCTYMIQSDRPSIVTVEPTVVDVPQGAQEVPTEFDTRADSNGEARITAIKEDGNSMPIGTIKVSPTC